MKPFFRTRDFHPDPERDLQEEIEAHLELKARDLMEKGMGVEEARREARRLFGARDEIEAMARRHARTRIRRERRAAFWESLVQDLRFALRTLWRNPGFTLVALLALSLGVGASSTVFSVADAALLRPLPFPAADRLVFLQGAFMGEEGPRIRGASIPEARDWASRNRTLEGAAAFFSSSFTLMGEGGSTTGAGGPYEGEQAGAERIQGEVVDAGYFRILRVSALRGRTFSSEEYSAPGGHGVAVVSETLWERRWGRSPGLLGGTVRVDGTPLTVVGILPKEFHGASLQAEIWVPLSFASESRLEDRGQRWLSVVGRLSPGHSADDAQADLDAVAVGLEEEFPDLHERRGVVVQSARDMYLGNTRALILVVFGATGLLLLISAINVTSLLMARASGREEEMSLRTALGAGRRRLFRQLLSESLVLAYLGAAAGLALSLGGVRVIGRLLPPGLLPPFVEVTLDPRMVLFAASAMVVVGLGAGLAPALQASRVTVAQSLRAKGLGDTRLQSSLVIGEVAVALLLLVGASLMTRSLQAQLRTNPGFDPQGLFAFRLELQGERYGGEALVPSVMDLQSSLEALPGVQAVAFGSNLPLRGLSSASYLWLPGHQDADDRVRFYYHLMGPAYLETLGVPMARGRSIADQPDGQRPSVAVISRAFAQRFFPGTDPVGQVLNLFGPGENPVRILGVAEDIRYRGITVDPLAETDDPDVFLPWVSVPGTTLEFIVRSRERPEALFASVREAVRSFDSGLVPYRMAAMADVLREQSASARSASVLLTIFSAAALLLAAIGVYGILAFAVRRRRREMAIRMTVGAEPGRLIRIVVLRALRLVGSGVILGLGAAALLSRSLSGLLYGVVPLDPPTYGIAVGTILFVAFGAALVPALRAATVDPQNALRAE